MGIVGLVTGSIKGLATSILITPEPSNAIIRSFFGWK